MGLTEKLYELKRFTTQRESGIVTKVEELPTVPNGLIVGKELITYVGDRQIGVPPALIYLGDNALCDGYRRLPPKITFITPLGEIKTGVNAEMIRERIDKNQVGIVKNNRRQVDKRFGRFYTWVYKRYNVGDNYP